MTSPVRWMSALGGAQGVEVVSGLLVAMTVKRGAITMATMRRIRTTPAASIPVDALLGQRRGSQPRLHLVVCEPDHVHRTLLVPPMSAAELTEVVRRDMGRDEDGDRVPVWRRVRRMETDGERKDEILIVSASPASVQQHLDPIIAGARVPRLVVTGPLALIAAARALLPTPLNRPTVLVHWGVSTLTIVIMSDGTLKFARVIEPPASDLNPLNWIPVEIDRSIRHYAVLSKGERVEQAIVSVAEGEPARRLFTGAEMAQRLRLPVTNLNALLAPLLPTRWDVDSELADVEMAEGAFMLAYGAAILTPEDVPNLLPAAFIVESRSRRVMAGAVAATVLLAVAFGWTAAVKADQAQGLRLALTRARGAEQARQVRAAEDGQIEAERQRMRQLVRLLTDDPLKHLPADDALREIARLAPADLRLDQLTLSFEASGYTFRLVGRVDSPDLADAQHTLNEFFYGLRGSPLFYDVESHEAASAPAPAAANAEAEPADQGGRSLPFVLTFKPKGLQ